MAQERKVSEATAWAKKREKEEREKMKEIEFFLAETERILNETKIITSFDDPHKEQTISEDK